MKNLISILTILIFILSCSKEAPFEYIVTDINGNIIGGDTTQGILKQDAPLTEGTDSICSQLLKLKNPKLRDCINGNIRASIYPNPFKSTDKVYLKFVSFAPIMSYSYANSSPTSMSVGGSGNNQKTVIVDITESKPTSSKSYFEFYLATIDSCVYHGKLNVLRE